jgi:hypothetical protein
VVLLCDMSLSPDNVIHVNYHMLCVACSQTSDRVPLRQMHHLYISLGQTLIVIKVRVLLES